MILYFPNLFPKLWELHKDAKFGKLQKCSSNSYGIPVTRNLHKRFARRKHFDIVGVKSYVFVSTWYVEKIVYTL